MLIQCVIIVGAHTWSELPVCVICDLGFACFDYSFTMFVCFAI